MHAAPVEVPACSVAGLPLALLCSGYMRGRTCARLRQSRSLFRWLASIQWTHSAQDPAAALVWSDAFWLELFWVVWTTGDLPPFFFEGAWVLLQDDIVLYGFLVLEAAGGCIGASGLCCPLA